MTEGFHCCDLGAGEFVDAWFDTVSLFGFCTLFALERNAGIIRMPYIRSHEQVAYCVFRTLD
jgi:hypothetical protein